MNWFINFVCLFLDKIEEAQKELNGAEVSKKGKLKINPNIYFILAGIPI